MWDTYATNNTILSLQYKTGNTYLQWDASKRCTTTREYANWGYQTVGRWRVTTTWEHTSPITHFLLTLHLLNVTFFSFIPRKSWRSTMSSRLDNGPQALFRALVLTDLLLVLFFGRKDGFWKGTIVKNRVSYISTKRRVESLYESTDSIYHFC